MRGARLQRFWAILVLALLAVGIFWLSRLLRAKGPTWAVNFSTIAAAALAAAALLMPLLNLVLRWLRGSEPISRVGMPQVREDLARRLALDWAQEDRARRTNDPRPLPVRWEITSLAEEAMAAGAEPAPAGWFNEISQTFSDLPAPRRLVILGEAGAGKSVLATKLARELLAVRPPDGRVPFILPAAAWDSGTDLHEWITGQLSRNYPGLMQRVRDTTGRVIALADALAADMILPIIDGLDELPEMERSEAITRINAYGSDVPLVLTSRSREYLAAVDEAGRGISRASVVEVRPLAVAEAIAYLREATADTPAGRWDELFDRLRAEPDGPLSTVLRTPLMLWLARSVYEEAPRDPAELAQFDSTEALQAYLLDAFVPAVYEARPGVRSGFRCTPREAERWLGFLADYLNRAGKPDFAWWRLARTAPVWRLISMTIRTVLVAATAWAVTAWVLTRNGYFRDGLYVRRASSWHAFLLDGPLGRLVSPPVFFMYDLVRRHLDDDLHHFMTVDLPERRFLPEVSLPAYLGAAAALGLYLGLTTVPFERRSTGPRHPRFRPARLIGGTLAVMFGRAALFILLAVILAGFFGAGGEYVAIPKVDGLVEQGSTWVAVALLSATGIALIARGQWTPLDVSRSVSPAEALRLDRRSRLIEMTTRRGINAVALWLLCGTEIALAYAALASISTAFVFLIGETEALEASYTNARIALFARRRMPWRIMSFLEDAHHRGVLRQVGAVYQFRHIRLQERLAEKHPRVITKVTDWAIRELPKPPFAWAALMSRDNECMLRDNEWARSNGLSVKITGNGRRHVYRDPRFDTTIGPGTEAADRDVQPAE